MNKTKKIKTEICFTKKQLLREIHRKDRKNRIIIWSEFEEPIRDRLEYEKYYEKIQQELNNLLNGFTLAKINFILYGVSGGVKPLRKEEA